MNLFIRRKAYNFFDRYDILDDTGRLAYTMDGFLTRIKGTCVMRDRAGMELLTLQKQPNFFFSNYAVTATKPLEFPKTDITQKFDIRPNFLISHGQEQLTLKGNLRACNFTIFHDEDTYAQIRKRVLRWGDSYILTVTNIQDAPLYCAITVAMDNALYFIR